MLERQRRLPGRWTHAGYGSEDETRTSRELQLLKREASRLCRGVPVGRTATAQEWELVEMGRKWIKMLIFIRSQQVRVTGMPPQRSHDDSDVGQAGGQRPMTVVLWRLAGPAWVRKAHAQAGRAVETGTRERLKEPPCPCRVRDRERVFL